MGPRSGNRGYERTIRPERKTTASFNGSTVWEPWLCASPGPGSWSTASFNGSTVWEPWLWEPRGPAMSQMSLASMGPRSGNRGYVGGLRSVPITSKLLQWVHGLGTVVMVTVVDDAIMEERASMGPRSG